MLISLQKVHINVDDYRTIRLAYLEMFSAVLISNSH